MKTHVLIVSRNFPKKHLKAGQPTYFESKIRLTTDPTIYAIVEPDGEITTDRKITTIRSNYELWKKRIDEVNQGVAILSVRYWSGLPYKSTQVEICQFKKGAGIGIEKIYFNNDGYLQILSDEKTETHSCIIKDISSIAKSDGLGLVDFYNWFCAYDKTKPMAMIHFTTHRYNIHNLKTICIK